MIRMLTNIDVDDLDEAVAFYRGALGLRLDRMLFEGTVAELGGAASPIYLSVKEAGSRANVVGSQTRDYARHWTPVHLDFVVDDLEPAVERAREAGAKQEGEIQAFEWGRQANLSDPFGHGFCLVQFVGRGYDEVA